jgi:hypothetical protein
VENQEAQFSSIPTQSGSAPTLQHWFRRRHYIVIDANPRFDPWGDGHGTLGGSAGNREARLFGASGEPQYQQLHREALSDDGVKAIYSWLMERDSSAWNPHATAPNDRRKAGDRERERQPAVRLCG